VWHAPIWASYVGGGPYRRGHLAGGGIDAVGGRLQLGGQPAEWTRHALHESPEDAQNDGGHQENAGADGDLGLVHLLGGRPMAWPPG